jgi:hypothetical protein
MTAIEIRPGTLTGRIRNFGSSHLASERRGGRQLLAAEGLIITLTAFATAGSSGNWLTDAANAVQRKVEDAKAERERRDKLRESHSDPKNKPHTDAFGKIPRGPVTESETRNKQKMDDLLKEKFGYNPWHQNPDGTPRERG